MWKITAGIVTVAMLLTIAFLAQGVATGIGVPYPDPSPEQSAFERYHRGIGMSLFVLAGAAWLATGISAIVNVGQWLMRTRRTESGDTNNRSRE